MPANRYALLNKTARKKKKALKIYSGLYCLMGHCWLAHREMTRDGNFSIITLHVPFVWMAKCALKEET
jgi:hypothetical protein